MKKFTFHATVRGLTDVKGTREKTLRRAFFKWLSSQGMVFEEKNVQVIEEIVTPLVPNALSARRQSLSKSR